LLSSKSGFTLEGKSPLENRHESLIEQTTRCENVNGTKQTNEPTIRTNNDFFIVISIKN
jgi:hypothetical protein